VGEGEEESELHQWLSTIKDILEDPTPNAVDFLDTLKLNLFAAEIVVFTPKGELLTLPANATVLDVAFALHSQIGSKCIAGKVNHKLVPLSYKLSSGDQVEVLTSQTQTPKPEWESILASAKARTRLRKALRQIQAPMIEKGKKIVRQFFDDAEVKATNELITKMMAYYKLTTREMLYYKIGAGEMTLDGYVLKDSPKTSPGLLKKIFRIGTGKSKSKAEAAKGPVIVTPDNINVKEVYDLRFDDKEQNFVFADCCRPIPGDDVMGFINDEGQVEVHSLSCPRAQVLKAPYGGRIVATRWANVTASFPARIAIEGVDRHGILQELTHMISLQLGIDIRSLHIDTQNEVFSCTLGVMVSNTNVINDLCNDIKKIKGVLSAVRSDD
jgi:hypothetical protein